jgi:murein tripeptide amidase MpaA
MVTGEDPHVVEMGESGEIPIPVGETPIPVRTMLFTVRGSDEAHKALTKMNMKKCHRSERGSDVCEFVGVAEDQERLQTAGFSLLQQQESCKFEQDGYNSPEKLQQKFEQLEATHQSLAKVINLTDLLNAPKTVKKKSIMALKISESVSEDRDVPNVMLASNHHARELVTPEIALRTATNLLADYESGDAVAKQILESSQVYIIWTMNPDSLEQVWRGNPWIRANTNGVDLNRNYAVGWDLGCGGDKEAGTEDYRGPHPFSESETKTMKMFQAKMNFAKVMDIHSYARDVRINYGCVDLPQQIHKLFMTHANAIAGEMKYPAGQSCCMGGDIHFAYQQHGSLAFLVEAGGDAFQPGTVEREEVLVEMWPGIKRFLAIPTSVSGHIHVDNAHTPAAGAVLKVPGLDFALGEQTLTSNTGRYHLWLPAGEWDVEVAYQSADGKSIVQTHKVTASEHGEVQDLVLMTAKMQ